MAEIKTETTMDGFVTKDRADYYSGITRITVNGKNVYELKGKFLDNLLSNAFSGTNEEDAVEHIDYFLRIVNLIKFPNVNYEQIRLAIFPISLVGNASKCNDHKAVADEEFSDAEEANNNDEQETAKIFRIETNLFDYETPLCKKFKEFNFLLKIDPELFTRDIEITKTYEDYENELNDELEEPWNHIRGPYTNFFTTYDPHLDINSIFGIKNNASNMSDVHDEDNEIRKDNAHNAAVCKIRRFEMIKYSFGQDENYVAIKESEYDDLTITNEDACKAYQEIFRSMEEGWMVTRAE
ncbi:hypothetical protein Tco_0506640 [Tanacetum coccineum]